jgi:hypothetical protein
VSNSPDQEIRSLARELAERIAFMKVSIPDSLWEMAGPLLQALDDAEDEQGKIVVE